jgi:inosine-uridine nucleoside N-ribohydrolase
VTIKVLLDTDIGGDIDDAVCLAYLLANPDCDLLGITTVSGQPVERARLASAICTVADRDIPIFPGTELPLSGEQRQPVAQQASVLPRWSHQADFPQDQAIDFLSRTIHSHPGEVILLTIGPLTNAARLFQADPVIPRLLKGLVIMGGVFFDDAADAQNEEWNLFCDPKAAEIVYRTPVRLHRSIGLDVTRQCVMSSADVRRRFTASILQPVVDMAEVWFSHFSSVITFHDPLAAATIFAPNLCTYKNGTIASIYAGSGLPYKFSFSEGGAESPHQAAYTVDPARFFAEFFNHFEEEA